jgi:hypothetical protein
MFSEFQSSNFGASYVFNFTSSAFQWIKPTLLS